MSELIAEYLTDPVDRMLFATTPCLMVPLNGELPELAVGGVRYLASSTGLFMEARSHAMRVVTSLAEGLSLPYGAVQPVVELVGGAVPAELIQQARVAAQRACPKEWAGWIWWDAEARRYRLWEPEVQEASAGRIDYRVGDVDPSHVLVDLHSHGDAGAWFSRRDDQDDLAFPSPVVMTGVFGKCRTLAGMQEALRVVANTRLIEVDWRPWA